MLLVNLFFAPQIQVSPLVTAFASFEGNTVMGNAGSNIHATNAQAITPQRDAGMYGINLSQAEHQEGDHSTNLQLLALANSSPNLPTMVPAKSNPGAVHQGDGANSPTDGPTTPVNKRVLEYLLQGYDPELCRYLLDGSF